MLNKIIAALEGKNPIAKAVASIAVVVGGAIFGRINKAERARSQPKWQPNPAHFQDAAEYDRACLEWCAELNRTREHKP